MKQQYNNLSANLFKFSHCTPPQCLLPSLAHVGHAPCYIFTAITLQFECVPVLSQLIKGHMSQCKLVSFSVRWFCAYFEDSHASMFDLQLDKPLFETQDCTLLTHTNWQMAWLLLCMLSLCLSVNSDKWQWMYSSRMSQFVKRKKLV